MLVSVIIAALTCICMILAVLFKPQIRIGRVTLDSYWPVVLVGATVMLASGQVDVGALGDALLSASSINPLKILVLFISMTILSIFLDEVGFFRYLANKTLSYAGNSQMKLLVILYVTVSVLTVFTSNDIIVLTFTPFICYFAKNAHINPRPYLVAEFIAANTMSMTLIIGNPTNIYIATSYNIGFVDYAAVMLLPTLASSAVAFLVLWLLFRRELQAPIQSETETVVIENKAFLGVGISILSICTVVLAVGPYFDVPMWIVSLFSALLLFLLVGILSVTGKKKPTELGRTLKRAPWPLIPFVLSMFVIILAVTQNGLTDKINGLLGESQPIFKYGICSFFAANLINNIPMSVLFCPVIHPLAAAGSEALLPAVYATVVGSNLGAYLTPIGALAGIMWMSLLKKHNVKFGYLDFMKYGAAVSLPALLANLLVLSLVL